MNAQTYGPQELIAGSAIDGIGAKVDKSPPKRTIDVAALLNEYCDGDEARSKWITEADLDPANWETRNNKNNWNVDEKKIVDFLSWVADQVLRGRVPTSAICVSPEVPLDFTPEHSGSFDSFSFVNDARSARWGVAIAWCQRELKRQLTHQIDHVRFPNEKDKYKQNEGYYNAQWRGLVHGIHAIRGIMADVWDARQRRLNCEMIELLRTQLARVGDDFCKEWVEDLPRHPHIVDMLRNAYYRDRNSEWSLIKRGVSGCMEFDGRVAPVPKERYKNSWHPPDESYEVYLEKHAWKKVLTRAYTQHEADFRRRERHNKVLLHASNKRKREA